MPAVVGGELVVGTGVEVGVGVAVGVGVVLSVGCDAAQAVLAEERALVAALDRVVASALALSTAFVSALKSMSLVFPPVDPPSADPVPDEEVPDDPVLDVVALFWLTGTAPVDTVAADPVVDFPPPDAVVDEPVAEDDALLVSELTAYVS